MVSPGLEWPSFLEEPKDCDAWCLYCLIGFGMDRKVIVFVICITSSIIVNTFTFVSTQIHIRMMK